MPRLPRIPSGKDFFSWPPVIASLALAALLLISSTARIVARARELRLERRAVAERITALEADRKRLEESLGALESREAVERLAKEKLGLKNPGEEVVVVLAEPEASGTPPVAEETHTSFLRFLPGWLRELVTFLSR